MLEEPAPPLSIHCIRQDPGLLVVNLWVCLNDLHQLTHCLLSRLKGPWLLFSLSELLDSDEGMGMSAAGTEVVGGGTGRGRDDLPL